MTHVSDFWICSVHISHFLIKVIPVCSGSFLLITLRGGAYKAISVTWCLVRFHAFIWNLVKIKQIKGPLK